MKNIVKKVVATVLCTANMLATDPQVMLTTAIINNSAVDVAAAVLAGADVNMERNGVKPVELAIQLGAHDALDGLITAGVQTGFDIMNEALAQRDITAALSLVTTLTYIPDINDVAQIIDTRVDDTAGLAFVQSMLDAGYVVDEIWLAGTTAKTRHFWLYHNPTILQFFLDHDANPDISIIDGDGGSWTPLLRAVMANNLAAVTALVVAGANVNLAAQTFPDDPTLYSPLLLALTMKRGAIAQYLVAHGATV